MISESPPQAAADASLSTSITVYFEVPDTSRSSNCELADAHDESIDPEEHENLVEGNVTSLVTPLHLRDELVSRARLWLTNREYENRTDAPDAEPYESNEIGKNGQKEDPDILRNILSCCLVDGDANSDGFPAAADTDTVEDSDTENSISRILQPLFVVTTWQVLLRLEVSVGTSGYECCLNQEN